MALSLRALPLVVVLAACAAPPGESSGERASRVAQPIIGGKPSDATQDAVALLVRYDPSLPGGMSADCSGTMLSPRIVLTARHCVSETDESAACNESGTADQGGHVLADFKPRSMFVFTGVTRPDILGGAGATRAAEIITNGAQVICNDDIALLVLEQPIANAKTAPVRLEGLASEGEKVTLVGWGLTEKGGLPDTRQQRAGVAIERVGPKPQLGPKEIEIGEGACSGDSGGPMISEGSGAVVGVLSRGGNGIDRSAPASCIGGVNVYTSTGAHAELVRAAFAKTGETPWMEGQPDPSKVPPDEGGGDAKSGCSVAHAGADASAGPLAAFAALGLVASAARRRRSPRVAQVE